MRVVVQMGKYGEASGSDSIFTEHLSDCVALTVVAPITSGAKTRGLFHILGANETTIPPQNRLRLETLARYPGSRLIIVYGDNNSLETGRRIFRAQVFISHLLVLVNNNIIERSATAVEIFSDGTYQLSSGRRLNEKNGVIIGVHRARRI